MDYEVRLEIFEGPLDLLLHLIHKNEVDIFDIPISTITDQYLEHLDIMKALNVDIAGDFLVMASTLIHIKSKMLLPGFNGEGEEDPRVEITRPLLEYMQFRDLAQDLSERDLLGRDVFARRADLSVEKSLAKEEGGIDVTLFQLMDAFKRIIEQGLPEAKLSFESDKWTVKEKTDMILSLLKDKKGLYFNELFADRMSTSEAVVTFLAILELVHMGLIRVLQPSLQSDIRLMPSLSGENVGTER